MIHPSLLKQPFGINLSRSMYNERHTSCAKVVMLVMRWKVLRQKDTRVYRIFCSNTPKCLPRGHYLRINRVDREHAHIHSPYPIKTRMFVRNLRNIHISIMELGVCTHYHNIDTYTFAIRICHIHTYICDQQGHRHHRHAHITLNLKPLSVIQCQKD